jgi:hypothetical protein
VYRDCEAFNRSQERGKGQDFIMRRIFQRDGVLVFELPPGFAPTEGGYTYCVVMEHPGMAINDHPVGSDLIGARSIFEDNGVYDPHIRMQCLDLFAL